MPDNTIPNPSTDSASSPLERGLFQAARLSWFLVTGLSIWIYAAIVPSSFSRIHYSTPISQAVLDLDFLLTRNNLVSIILGIEYLTDGIFLIMAAILFTQLVLPARPINWIALYVSLLLVLLVLYFDPLDVDPWALRPPWGRILSQVNLYFSRLAEIGLILFFFIFPDGRFIPRWTRWLAPLVILWFLLPASWFGPDFSRQPVFLALIAAGVLAQIYRFRHASTPVSRQQTKWAVLGFFLLSLLWIGLLIYEQLQVIVPASGIEYVILVEARKLALLLVPFSLGFSILRYRLWEIDFIIRRTLAYAFLTLTLAVIYFSSIILLQWTSLTLLGRSQSKLATVLSTLMIAALFLPLREQVQRGIDRRFYRRRYDSERALANFSAGLRHQTDLEQVSAQLLGVVESTLQPRQATLWLKSTLPRKDE